MENKTSKYFKYAIGEIILVVIGILIALQINNWNENDKDRVYEYKMLSEIKKALEGDIIHFEWMINRMEKLDSATNVMAQHIIDNSKFIDSLYLHKGISRYYSLSMGTSYQYNAGLYDALKSSGIEKVTNDSLRNSIISLYDFELPRRKILIEWAEGDYKEQKKTLKSFFGPTEVIRHEDHYDYVQKFPDDLFQKPEFSKLLGEIHTRARNVRGYYMALPQMLQKLVNQIEIEIKNYND